jgi:acetate---CoA ligase (ADP-forming)
MRLSAGLDKIFRPKSIAIVGATVRKGTIGREITHNLISYGFTGKIFPVNPSADAIHSIKCYPSILDIPDQIDLAIIMVRKDLVLSVVDECGRKGVGGVIVITSGFKEVGPEGAKREEALLERVRHYGMRMIGPNCFGIINTHPDLMMNATFSRNSPLPGKIGFVTQSGALGEGVLNHARKLGIGFSMFVSMGNKADISGNTILDYWMDDPATKIILVYLESFGDPATFSKIAREITKTKPIIAIKSGRTAAGARATASHTGALAGDDIGVDALFDQCGILRVNSSEELFDLTKAFDQQPVPKGNRVAVLTNAGGPGILATDAAAAAGLDVVHLDPKTTEILKANLPPEAAIGNLVDMIASATPDQFEMALDCLSADPNVDGLIIVFVPPIMIDEMAVADAIIRARARTEKPYFTCFMGPGEGSLGADRLKAAGIPIYTFPESIAGAYATMVKYATRLKRPAGTFPSAPTGVAEARTVLAQLASSGKTTVLGSEALEIIARCGIPTTPIWTANDFEQAAKLAGTVGYPVVLKLDAPDLVHKTEVGGVITDVRDETELRKHYETLLRRAEDTKLSGARVVVQAMVKGGIEMVLGMVHDPTFGPMIMCGLGGVFVEVMKDVTFKLPPLSREDASEMIDRLKAKRLLSGYRGSAPMDLEPLVNSLLVLSRLVEDFPLITELDINPFVVCADSSKSRAIDARIVLASATA